MRKIYLLRHGETRWNREGRLQGHLDSPLTELGKAQARASGLTLCEHLAGRDFVIQSSPLGRCIQTACIVADLLDRQDICQDDRLQELCYGDWQGMKKDEIQATDGARYQARIADRWHVPAPGGECYADVAARLESWRAESQHDTIIAISHGCTGRILRGLHAGLNARQITELDEPQDVIYVLREGGVIERLGPILAEQ